MLTARPRPHEIARFDQKLFKRGQLVRWQPAYCLSDEGTLTGDRLFGGVATSRGQEDRVLTLVGGHWPPLDQAGGDQPVDEAGDIALSDIEPFGQVLLTDPLLFRQCR